MAGSHLERGRILYRQDRHAEAVAELTRSLAEDPECADSHAYLALSLSEMGKNDEAIDAARRAVQAQPDSPFTHNVHASVLFDVDRNQEALQAIDEAIRILPEEPGYHSLRSAILFDEGQTKRALASAERGLAIDPEHVSCLNMRSMALTRLGRRDEAHEGLEAALQADPDSAVSHANRGWTYLHSGDAREALTHFSEALRLDPTSEWARAGLIEALKARNFIYRGILAWYLLCDRISGRARWAWILGFMLGARVLRKTLERNEKLAPLAGVVGVLYISVIWLSWVAVPLFNLLLFLDRIGRNAMSKEQRSSALVFGGSLLLTFGTAGLNLAVGHLPMAGVLTLAGLGLGIPVASVSMMDPGRKRFGGWIFVGVIATALLFASMLHPLGLDPENGVPIAIAAVCFGVCMLSTWVLSFSRD